MREVAGVLAAFAVGLMVHHGIVHGCEKDSNAQRESVWWVGYFQIKDIMHYETWAVVCFATALGLGLTGPAQAWGLTLATLCALGAALVLLAALTEPSLEHVHNHETWAVAALASAVAVFVASS